MLNKVILSGRLTADAELKQFQNDLPMCRFTIAVNRDFSQSGEERQADFITIVAWRKTAEFVCKYFSKGDGIIVEGSLRTGSYNDKKYHEVKHYTTEVYADKVYFNGKKSAAPTDKAASPEIGNLSDFEEIISDGKLPF